MLSTPELLGFFWKIPANAPELPIFVVFPISYLESFSNVFFSVQVFYQGFQICWLVFSLIIRTRNFVHLQWRAAVRGLDRTWPNVLKRKTNIFIFVLIVVLLKYTKVRKKLQLQYNLVVKYKMCWRRPRRKLKCSPNLTRRRPRVGSQTGLANSDVKSLRHFHKITKEKCSKEITLALNLFKVVVISPRWQLAVESFSTPCSNHHLLPTPGPHLDLGVSDGGLNGYSHNFCSIDQISYLGAHPKKHIQKKHIPKIGFK